MKTVTMRVHFQGAIDVSIRGSIDQVQITSSSARALAIEDVRQQLASLRGIVDGATHIEEVTEQPE